MTATARRLGDTLTHEVDVNGRHTILTDEPAGLGGSDRGPAPHELLAATLASCISTTIAMYATSRDWELSSLAVAVDYDPKATPRRFTVEVELPAGLSEQRLARLQRVAESCPVRRALESTFEFDERLISPGRDLAPSSRTPSVPAVRAAGFA